ncbi:MAG: LPS export ABC transporter periplasmic protein LptC [Calditrichaeota bacterium]|nr:MAG: LPS export ABC transporter periplasmic protein LptC [Calditrichota bacterium]
MASLVVFLCACQTNQEVGAKELDLSKIPEQEGWDATLISSRDGKETSRIKYAHMQRFSNENLVKFSGGLTMELFDDNGKLISTVSADSGSLNEVSRTLDLAGDVVVKSRDGVTLKTETLRWYESLHKVSSEDFVTVISAERDTIYGTGFESEQSLLNWVIRSPSGVTQRRLRLEAVEEPKKDVRKASN